jgi:hypothetical protein
MRLQSCVGALLLSVVLTSAQAFAPGDVVGGPTGKENPADKK